MTRTRLTTRYPRLAAALALCALPGLAFAHDPWEFPQLAGGGGGGGDDISGTLNVLAPGLVQQHDLDQTGQSVDDSDWALVPTLAYHSYEARLTGTTALTAGGSSCCVAFQRWHFLGFLLQEGVPTMVADGIASRNRTLRWIAPGVDATEESVRVAGAPSETEGPGHIYTLRFWDTTYVVPRWNASGGQTTIFVFTSLVPQTVTAYLQFYKNVPGSLQGSPFHSQMLTLERNKPIVFSTATAPALAGQSGFATIAHSAGYGGLSGKVVAVDPATGFTFDTALSPIEQ